VADAPGAGAGDRSDWRAEGCRCSWVETAAAKANARLGAEKMMAPRPLLLLLLLLLLLRLLLLRLLLLRLLMEMMHPKLHWPSTRRRAHWDAAPVPRW